MYYFGEVKSSQELVLHLPNTVDMNKVEVMQSRTATFTAGNAFPDNVQLSCIPVNGIPFYYMLGNSTSAGADPDCVHTVTTHATDAKPSMSVFRQGNAATEKRKAAGCISRQLTWDFKLGFPVDLNHAFQAITDAMSADTPTGSTFPQSVTSAFDVMSTFTANAVGYSVEECSGVFVHKLTPYGNNARKYRGVVDTSPVYYSLVANLKGDITALRTLKDAYTGHTVITKVVKSLDTAKYFQITNTMYIYDINDRFFISDASDRAVVSWIGSSPSVAILDGVNKAFYGD
jgi:hypothetical protein